MTARQKVVVSRIELVSIGVEPQGDHSKQQGRPQPAPAVVGVQGGFHSVEHMPQHEKGSQK
ncbi:MAG: hypothetical protein ACKOB4_03550 [Acidobacteriota bacterium]